MEILPDAMLIVDHRQMIADCNRAAETLFGYRFGELVGKPLNILIPPALRESHAGLVAQHDSSAMSRPMENRPVLFGVSKAGVRLPLSIGISTIGTKDAPLFIAVVRDAMIMEDALEGAMALAETDPLTRLGNRSHLSSMLNEFAEDPARIIALLFLDLDKFKPLNDEYGHEFGDEVLRITARRLSNGVRESDTCIRLGGDEFVVVHAGVDDADILERIALKLHAIVTVPIRIGEATARVGVSIGGVVGFPYCVGSAALLKQADEAMYQAKRQGVPYCKHSTLHTAAA
jgi:diguanylate cyclase (GGDEF)-like protein/PAS domain S-box-containing protein